MKRTDIATVFNFVKIARNNGLTVCAARADGKVQIWAGKLISNRDHAWHVETERELILEKEGGAV